MVERYVQEQQFLAELREEILDRSARIERTEGNQVVWLGEEVRINVGSQWRLIDREGVIVTDTDDGQWFGLSAPVDAPAVANEKLSDQKVVGFKFDGTTGDLSINFGGGLILEIITNSSGYESWVMWLRGEHFAVGANGGLR